MNNLKKANLYNNYEHFTINKIKLNERNDEND